KDFGFIPVPKRLQYNVEKPFHFGLPLNIAFGAASTFTVMNLYWCQPLLIELSKDFNISYEEVPGWLSLLQLYATGLLFLTPLGDLVRRRQLILILIFVAASLTIGLSVTTSFRRILRTFVPGRCSHRHTPSPHPTRRRPRPTRARASAMSIVLAGLLLGILLARVLSGVIGEFVSWRAVYYLAIGVQYFVMVACYWVVPDYPARTNI
ncbi:hypothetical protein BDZ89DRAFT_1186138, partial [Hymenopellis radicata]